MLSRNSPSYWNTTISNKVSGLKEGEILVSSLSLPYEKFRLSKDPKTNLFVYHDMGDGTGYKVDIKEKVASEKKYF